MKNKRDWFRKEVAPLLLTLVLVTAARSSLADHYYVPSGSMENTLFAGDRVVVDKTAYGWRIPYTKIDLIDGARPQAGRSGRIRFTCRWRAAHQAHRGHRRAGRVPARRAPVRRRRCARSERRALAGSVWQARWWSSISPTAAVRPSIGWWSRRESCWPSAIIAATVSMRGIGGSSMSASSTGARWLSISARAMASSGSRCKRVLNRAGACQSRGLRHGELVRRLRRACRSASSSRSRAP